MFSFFKKKKIKKEKTWHEKLSSLTPKQIIELIDRFEGLLCYRYTQDKRTGEYIDQLSGEFYTGEQIAEKLIDEIITEQNKKQ